MWSLVVLRISCLFRFMRVCLCVHRTYPISSRSWACLVCWTADGTWVLRPGERPNHLRPSLGSCWPKMWWRKSWNCGKRQERCVYMSTNHLKGTEKILLLLYYIWSAFFFLLRPLIAWRLPGVISQLLINCRISWRKQLSRQWLLDNEIRQQHTFRLS